MTENKKQIRLIVFGLMMGMLLSALDQTIVSTAMPTVIKDLGGFSLYSWVFSIYMLTSTTAVPIFGKLADLYGRRLIYLIGMGLFVVGSALCGLAQNMTEMIIFRGIQGIGAGALMPIAMIIIGDIFPPDRRGKMQGIFGAVFGLSSVVGPAVGGFLVEHLTWQWIFYVNLPFGILAAFVLGIALKESKGTEKKSIDWSGAITLSGAIVSILLALVLGGGEQGAAAGTHYAWDSPQIIGLFSAGAVLIGIFLWIESKAKEPIIPLHLFKIRTISVTNIAGFFMGVGMFGAITYIPLFVQAVIGESPSKAGYILTPLMLSLIFSSIIGGRLITKFTYRAIIFTGMAVMALGFYLMSQMDVHTSNFTVVIYMIITGLGMGPLMPTFTISVQSAVGHEQRGVATSSSQFFRSIGGTIGVSVMGAIMANRMTSEIEGLVTKLRDIPADELKKFADPQLLLEPAVRKQMPPQLLEGLQTALVHSISWVFAAGLIAVLIGMTSSIFLGNERLKKNKEPENEGPEEKVQLEML